MGSPVPSLFVGVRTRHPTPIRKVLIGSVTLSELPQRPRGWRETVRSGWCFKATADEIGTNTRPRTFARRFRSSRIHGPPRRSFWRWLGSPSPEEPREYGGGPSSCTTGRIARIVDSFSSLPISTKNSEGGLLRGGDEKSWTIGGYRFQSSSKWWVGCQPKTRFTFSLENWPWGKSAETKKAS